MQAKSKYACQGVFTAPPKNLFVSQVAKEREVAAKEVAKSVDGTVNICQGLNDFSNPKHPVLMKFDN